MSADKEVRNFPALLEAQKHQIERALPKHLNADRMSRIALTAFRQNPLLGRCDPMSVFASVIQSAQVGLEVGILGQAFLVPYKDRSGNYICQFIPGWKGLVDLVNRAGNASVWTGAVFDGDFFEYAMGDRPFISHKPTGSEDPDKLTHVYAVGRVAKAEWPVIEVWTIDKVRRHLERYNKVGDKHYAYKNWEMYARKVVLLQVLKYMPASPELARAMHSNDQGEIGGQRFAPGDRMMNDIITGEFSPTNDEPEQRKEVPGPKSKDEAKTADDEKQKHADDAAAQAVKDEPKGPGFVTAGALNMLRSKAATVRIPVGNICQKFDVDMLRDLTTEQGNAAMEWLREE